MCRIPDNLKKSLQMCMRNEILSLHLIFIIIISNLSGCKVGDTNSTRSFISNDQYVLKEKYQYTLPSESYLICSIQYFIDNGIDYVSILNGMTNEIVIYNLVQKSQIERILLPDLGAKSMLFHRMNNLDSIQILNFFSSPTIFTLSNKGEVINKLPINTYDGSEILSFPICFNSLPVQYINGKYYIPLRPYSWDSGIEKESFKNYYSYLILDSTGDREFRYKLPEVYDQFFWGMYSYKYTAALCPVNGSKDCFFVGHSIDPEIALYNSDKLVKKQPIPSKIVNSNAPYFENVKTYKKLIEKINKGKTRAPEPNSMKQWVRSSSDYGRIIYDKNSDLYMRTVYIRPNLGQVKEGLLVPKYSFIIFDKDMKWLGETCLPEGFNAEVIFVNKEGIHIQRKSKDGIEFSVFEIVKK